MIHLPTRDSCCWIAAIVQDSGTNKIMSNVNPLISWHAQLWIFDRGIYRHGRKYTFISYITTSKHIQVNPRTYAQISRLCEVLSTFVTDHTCRPNRRRPFSPLGEKTAYATAAFLLQRLNLVDDMYEMGIRTWTEWPSVNKLKHV